MDKAYIQLVEDAYRTDVQQKAMLLMILLIGIEGQLQLKSLPPPILDDRRYEDLLEELRSRIPDFSPEWTDMNESDPGQRISQLFTFLDGWVRRHKYKSFGPVRRFICKWVCG